MSNTQPWSTLRAPSKDWQVTALQFLLRAHGQAIVADGDFGPATTAAVKAVQAAAGLTQDGVVGPLTWPHVVVQVGPGSNGDAVRAVQSLPFTAGTGVDGVYGPATQQDVTSFQASWGLAADGIVGPQTWSFLVAANAWGIVRPGARQDDNGRVLAAQHLLRAHGASITADGTFGAASGAALQAFQHTIRSSDFGTTVGQLDWPALITTLSAGAHGEAVMALQSLLPSGVTIDGQFGPATGQAVRDFQNAILPPADGIVGPRTWQSLLSPFFD